MREGSIEDGTRGFQGQAWKWHASILATFLWPELNHVAPCKWERWRSLQEGKLRHQQSLSSVRG